MVELTLNELRDLSRRSRRAHAWGLLVVVSALLALPAHLLLAALLPAWSSWSAVLCLAVPGGLFVRYAHVVGQSRGAFRAVFRKVHRASREALRNPPAAVAEEVSA